MQSNAGTSFFTQAVVIPPGYTELRFDLMQHYCGPLQGDVMQIGIDGINMPGSDWNGGLVTLFHRFGRTAFSWGLQHDHELVSAIRMGADGVYSDHVDRMSDAARNELS